MEQELKRIAPLSVLTRALLVFGCIGILAGILVFLLLYKFDPRLAEATFGQRLLGFVVFVPIYTVVVGLSMTIMALLYNFWASKIGGIKITLTNSDK